MELQSSPSLDVVAMSHFSLDNSVLTRDGRHGPVSVALQHPGTE